MADFHQTGTVATLHNLRSRDPGLLERDLAAFARNRRITLILPSLYSELEGPALGEIVKVLAGVNYLDEIVVGLDRADERQFAHAREFFSVLPQRHRILWNDGPRLRALDDTLASGGLAPAEPGKGRNVWYCIGYVLAAGRADVIALHDCDIVTYSREMLARLIYPVANPSFPYVFCKGYYARIAEGKLNGRVTRLLVTPLLIALEKTIGHHDYIDYLKGFRYPLTGEFAMRVPVLPDIRIPSDWGLEIGVLSEVWRNLSDRSACQVDIADHYDHKHQPLSDDNPQAGLSRMSIDIAKALYRKLATDGVVFGSETFRTLKATYYRTALDMIEAYYNDAVMNGLSVDRHREEQAVELFAANIVEAGQTFLDNPMETPFIPNWRRVNAAFPDLMADLHGAVEADNC